MSKTATAIKEPEAQEKPKLELNLTNLRKRREELFQGFLSGILEQAQFTPETNEQIGVYLKGTIQQRDELVDLIQTVEDEAERIRKEETRLAALRKDLEKLATNFRDSISFQLDSWQIRRVDGELHRISLRDGTDRVVIDDEALLPADFIDWKPTPDKAAIGKALREGREVPGAHLETSNKFVVIR